MNKSFFQELLGSVTERGRALIDRSPARQTADGSEHAAPSAEAPETLESLCHALLSGRDYVTPHDVKSLARDVLRHRIIVSYEADAEGQSADSLLGQILDRIPVP